MHYERLTEATAVGHIIVWSEQQGIGAIGVPSLIGWSLNQTIVCIPNAYVQGLQRRID